MPGRRMRTYPARPVVSSPHLSQFGPRHGCLTSPGFSQDTLEAEGIVTGTATLPRQAGSGSRLAGPLKHTIAARTGCGLAAGRFRVEHGRAAQWRPVARRPVCTGVLVPQEAEDALRGLVGLGQHRGAGLLQDLQLGEVDHLGGHVHVADAALGRGQVLLVGGEVVERVLEAVLHRAEGRAGIADTFWMAASIEASVTVAAEVEDRRSRPLNVAPEPNSATALTVMVSPSLAPTWKVIGAGAGQQGDAVELACRCRSG